MNYQSTKFYIDKAKNLSLHNPNNIKKIALLSNFTIQGLADILKVFSNEHKFDVDIYESPYNQFKQEIIDQNSKWYKFQPELSFIILDFDSLIGDIKFEFYSLSDEERKDIINQTCNELENILTTALENQSGKLVVSNFIVPNFSPLGIFDSKIKFSLRTFVNSLNDTIHELTTKQKSLYCLELDNFVKQFGLVNVTSEKFRYLADMKISPSFLPNLGEFLMCFIKPLFGKSRKCLVLDLDNSLWGGIIGEDGIDGIKLDNKPPGNSYLEFQKVILELCNRGVILAINSKNYLEDVEEVFEKHPNMILKQKHFASIFINWNNKASNMVSIAEDLNIGLDSLVFWDDDPVNRDLIRQKLPEVLTLDVPNDSSLYSSTLRSVSDFNSFQITEEDRKKGRMYVEQSQRKQFEKKFSDIKDFLSSLNMQVKIETGNEFSIPRISQLTMKTNQFNLTTKRYSEENIRKMLSDPAYLVKTFVVNDKFGDNGLTGLYIVKKDDSSKWTIDTFLMSCRIMGRDIEKSMFYDLINEAKKAGVSQICGNYFETKKNRVTKALYTNFGFTKSSDSQFILKNISDFEFELISYIKIS